MLQEPFCVLSYTTSKLGRNCGSLGGIPALTRRPSLIPNKLSTVNPSLLLRHCFYQLRRSYIDPLRYALRHERRDSVSPKIERATAVRSLPYEALGGSDVFHHVGDARSLTESPRVVEKFKPPSRDIWGWDESASSREQKTPRMATKHKRSQASRIKRSNLENRSIQS